MPQLAYLGLNTFSAAAALCFVLLTIETLYIVFFVKETSSSPSSSTSSSSSTSTSSSSSSTGTKLSSKDVKTSSTKSLPVDQTASPRPKRITRSSGKLEVDPTTISSASTPSLNKLARAHMVYLFFFSGMEFTLTFLTFDRFQFSNVEQGYLLGAIGILSSLIQGGYVRRRAHKIGEKRIVMQGMVACFFAFASLAVVGTKYDPFAAFGLGKVWSAFGSPLMVMASLSFAFASGTVVNGLTALASLFCGIEYQEREKGEVLGKFRSFGQLGRALGPLVGCSIYWLAGSVACYVMGAVGILMPFLVVSQLTPPPPPSQRGKAAAAVGKMD